MYALEPHPIGIERALAELESESFLEPGVHDDVQGFRHALMQEVAYSGILLRIRKVLHESAARLGEEHFKDRLEFEAPFFAHHFWEADLRTLAAPHLWHAGRTAALSYDLYAAERFLERLAAVVEEDPDLLGEAPERAQLLDTYGTVLLYRGRYDPADSAFERLASLGESRARPEWIGQAFKGRGEIAMFRGQFDQAEVFYAQGLAPLADSEGRLRADLHTGLGLVHYYRARAEDALKQHREALALRERIDDQLGMAKSFINIGNALHALRDDLAGAQVEYERALMLAKEVADRRLQCGILLNLGALALERGDWEEALTRLGDVEELAEELGLSLIRFLSLQNQAECHLALGHVERTIAILETCLRQGEAMLKAPNRVAVRLLLFRAHLTALDDAQAAEKLDEARRVAEEMKLTEQDDWLRMSEGRLSAVHGRWSDAARSFADAVEAANRIGHPVVAWLARAHLARAIAKSGGPEVELPTIEFPDYKPVAAVVAYLSADALASRAPSRDAAIALEEAGELAARLNSVALERAAFARLAKVWDELKEDEAREAAARRAAAAMAALEKHLPPDLRKTFTTHPENAALRPLAPT
jgi:tetratricopeptide (TPR) repeat protein